MTVAQCIDNPLNSTKCLINPDVLNQLFGVKVKDTGLTGVEKMQIATLMYNEKGYSTCYVSMA